MKPSNSIHQWRAPKQRHVTPKKVKTTPTERVCTRCKALKPITEFYFCTRDQRHIARCKACLSEIKKIAYVPSSQRPRRGDYARKNVKLTVEDVKLIKNLLVDRDYHYEQWQRLTYRALAEKFEVSVGCIAAIADGKNWKDVL
jgi:hypothetical protein